MEQNLSIYNSSSEYDDGWIYNMMDDGNIYLMDINCKKTWRVE